MPLTHFNSPTYLEQWITYDNQKYFTDVIENIEWRGQLISSAGNTKFRIKYYGIYHEDISMIGDTEDCAMLVVAEDISTLEEIVIFDGCRHGYDPMFCDEFDEEVSRNREAEHVFQTENGSEVFEIVISAYYQIDYEDEKEEFVNEDGSVTLMSGENISFESLKRNGFDVFFIKVYSEDEEEGRVIVERELA